MTDAQIAAWLWLLAHEDWCSFFYDKHAYVERPSAEDYPPLNETQLAAMDQACEQLCELGWVERSRRADRRGWWYRVDRRRADHLPRTWSVARKLLSHRMSIVGAADRLGVPGMYNGAEPIFEGNTIEIVGAELRADSRLKSEALAYLGRYTGWAIAELLALDDAVLSSLCDEVEKIVAREGQV